MTLCCMQDDIVFKGVVFNEMKGVYSQPDSMNNTITQHVSSLRILVGASAHYCGLRRIDAMCHASCARHAHLACYAGAAAPVLCPLRA